ncbi:MAG: peptidase T [Ignavibacteria bacterium]|nr:peptidase T [Ignavibacteria bacterium]
MDEKLIERFLKYVKIDTQSNEHSTTCPSTEKQLVLAKLLVEELNSLGLSDVSLDENGYVMATLPSNIDKQVPVIGFIAHMDTSPDMSGENVNPQIVRNYDGGDIIINKEKNLILSPKIFPELKEFVGHTLITTDGNTLLGADDKAGIAEIITAIEYFVKNPTVKHGTVKIAFTPDEEIGRGVDKFDVKKFGADFAYTVDGSGPGELEYENFNAAKATVRIQGRNVHPGYAKNKMLNAILIAMEFNSLLPINERPEYTQDYEGFYHIIKMDGSVENATLVYIIRDHDRVKFENKKTFIKKAGEFIEEKFGKDVISIEVVDQYYNMREKVEPVFHIVEIVKEAMELVGVTPKVVPIRGGTDGSKLSYMGLPCPNIFAGGMNFHGKFEYVSTETMEKAKEVIIKIIELYAQK